MLIEFQVTKAMLLNLGLGRDAHYPLLGQAMSQLQYVMGAGEDPRLLGADKAVSVVFLIPNIGNSVIKQDASWCTSREKRI